MKFLQNSNSQSITVQVFLALVSVNISSCSASNSQVQKLAEANIELMNHAQTDYYIETNRFSANVIEKQNLPIKPGGTEFTYKTDIQPNLAFSYALSQQPYYQSIVGGAFAFKDAEGRPYVRTILCRAKQTGSQSISPPSNEKTCGDGTKQIEQ